jgi:TPR repeat protein
MHPITIRILVATFAVALILSARPARADMYTATQAYDKGDFASAFQQFKELAELGQPIAQLNLAIMYGRGKGVAANATYAHAWGSLAAQNGEERGKAIAEELAASLTPTSLQVSSEIQAQYSQAKLNARLLPHVLNGR